MSKMKLTGEYQLTDFGVTIEGKVHNTNIPELRQKFGSRSPFYVTLSPGFYDDIVSSGVQSVSSVQYKMLSSKWFDAMKSLGLLTNEDVNKIIGVGGVENLSFATEFVRYGFSQDNVLMTTRTLTMRPVGRARSRTQNYNTVNVGWIFDKVQPDGNFKVDLYGLINRHMLTMILGRASSYAKLLDSNIVRQLSDNPENLIVVRRNDNW